MGRPTALGADSAGVAIAFTPHRLYRETAAGVEAAAKEKKLSYVLVELPTVSPESGQPGATEKTGPDEATPPAATRPASRTNPSEEARKRLSEVRPSIIVAVGAESASLSLEAIPNVPVVFCMVPNALDAPFMAEGSRHKSRVAGVATDVSPLEQISWTMKLGEDVKNIGVLYSARTKRTVAALREAGQSRGLTITPIETNRADFLKAIDQLGRNRCDGVIMLPDADVYNTPTVQRLLLWGLRARKPVWAFSSKIVKAGAFAGWQAKEDAIGRQTIELAERILAGTEPASIGVQYPARISCSINERSAEMIGVSVSDEVLDLMEARFGGNE